ncbi:MAG: hypothetical protein JSR73_03460 [Proteobacteria bacterium]|nr:hypothetical protein [Pseudomonadota bacterium]
MTWRVGLVDSGAPEGLVRAATRFTLAGAEASAIPDPSGHGSRVATILAGASADLELVLAQVFDEAGPTTPVAVAAGLDWCVAAGATLVHLSLGLAADRAPLAAAVARALRAGCLVVAATPARGGPVYPAAYPGVIRGTGDARCAPGEISRLDAVTFGGCVRAPAGATAAGASIGAAHVSQALLRWARSGTPPAAAIQALVAHSRYDGPERRGATAPAERGDA